MDGAELLREFRRAEPRLSRRAKKRKYWYAFVLLLLLTPFTLVLAYLVQSAVRQSDTAEWTPVAANVTVSELERVPTRRGHGARFRVEYAYQFDGQSFSSTRTHFGPDLISSRRDSAVSAGALSQLFPLGPTTAHIDPTDPSRSVLVNGPISDFYSLIGFILCVFCLWYLVLPAILFSDT